MNFRKISVDICRQEWYSNKAVCDTRCNRKKFLKNFKFGLDNVDDLQYNKQCSAVVERVPCKLNNERNEKHQTGAQKCATKAWGSGVKSITRGTKDKKF